MSFRRKTSLGIGARVSPAALSVVYALLCAGTALAEIPEPDAVVYGKVRHRFAETLIASESGQFSVVAKVNGITLAEYTLPAGADAYLLRIPMDDGRAPRQPNTAKSGDRVRFFLRDNTAQREHECVQSYDAPWLLRNERAPLAALDLAVAANVAGAAADTDGDSIPDYWEDHYGLDTLQPNAGVDSDGDGMSDREEFLAGTDPRNGISKLRIGLQRQKTGPDMQLTISPAFSDRSYSVQMSSKMNDEWTEYATVQPTESGDLVMPLSALQGQALFFRVVVESGDQ